MALFDPLPRSRPLAAWWRARSGVRAKVLLPSYLEWRLDTYMSQRPVDGYPLPKDVRVEGASVVAIENPDYEKHPLHRLFTDPPTNGMQPEGTVEALTLWIRVTEPAAAPPFAQRLLELQDHVTEARASLAAVTERLGKARSSLREDVEQGVALAPTSASRLAWRRTAPPGRLTFPVVAFLLMAAIVLTVETWQFALPTLDMTGVDIFNLQSEFAQRPIPVVMGFFFAFSASVALCWLWHFIIELVASLSSTALSRRRRIVMVTGVGLLAIVLVAIVGGISLMRYRLAESASSEVPAPAGNVDAGDDVDRAAAGRDPLIDRAADRLTFFLLTGYMPFALAYVWDRLGPLRARLKKEHEEAVASARQEIDRDMGQVAVWDRHAEAIRLMESEEKAFRTAQERAQREYRTLTQQAETAQKQLRRRLEFERRERAAFLDRLLGALAIDRYYFEREARRRGAPHLLLLPVAKPEGHLVSEADEPATLAG